MTGERRIYEGVSVCMEGSDRRCLLPACWECVWIQALASLIVNAFQNNGVHADSLRPYRSRVRYQICARQEPLKTDTYLSRRNTQKVSLRSWLGDRGLRKGKHENVRRVDPFLLNAYRSWSIPVSVQVFMDSRMRFIPEGAR